MSPEHVREGRSGAVGPVGWLIGQAILFGAMAAILGVVANAMFLEAYGASWLPVTYVVIGVAGVAVATALRRGAERVDLLRLAVAVLGAAAALFAVSWRLAAGPGGAWVSAPLLVVFPILIQLGFVFIGGQAGRVLDISGIKASFPRIMAGFPIGATVGGIGAVPLVDAFGRVEDLLLVVAVVQGAFAFLVWATGRRFRRELAAPAVATAPTASVGREMARERRSDLSLRGLLQRPLIALVLAYQVLSALGSQVADFLVFDRASALYPDAEDLGRFLAGYTAVMNGVAILFLAVLAGPLLRRYGLRLGIGANPIVDLLLALAILAVLVAAGPASIALLGIVSAARIADIALTDGMTRTSINALYQALPAAQRLATQATVEGMGVPIAIGASGVVILVIDALPEPLAVRIILLMAVCAAWAWVSFRLYREYAPALAVALRRRRLLEPEAPIEATLEDLAALGVLAAGDDPRAAKLARELAAAISEPAIATGNVPLGQRAVRLRDAFGDPAALVEDVAHPDRAVGLVAIERLAALERIPAGAETALDVSVNVDLEHAEHVLRAMAGLSLEPAVDPGGVVARALEEERQLLARRVAGALVARHGQATIGAAVTGVAHGAGEAGHGAIAAEVLEVALGHEAAIAVVALLAPDLPAADRLDRLAARHARIVARAPRQWLLALAEDRDESWRSPWLQACAIRALRLGGFAADLEVGGIAHADDATVREELALVGS